MLSLQRHQYGLTFARQTTSADQLASLTQTRELVDVVIRQGVAILELRAVAGQDVLNVENLDLQALNGFGCRDVQSDRLARQGLHEDLEVAG